MKQHILAAVLGAVALSGCATVAPRAMQERPTSKSMAEPPKGDAVAGAAQVAPEPPPPPKEKTEQEIFAEGVAAFDAGRYDDARAAFVEALRKAPDDVHAQYNLGVIAERQGDLARAQAAYESAHLLDPTHLPSVLNLGKVYRQQEKLDKAIALYEQALSQPGHEHDVALMNNLVVAYRLAKLYGKAEAAARKVLSRASDNVDAYKNLALIYYDEGQYRLAEFISGNARKMNDKDPGIYNNLGLIYLKMGDPARALAQFQKAVSLDDKFAPGHLNIGAMALSHRDYAGAEKAFARAVELDPSSYEAKLYFAYALDGQKGSNPKKGVAAGEAFEKVLAMRADHPDAICGAGWAYAADRAGWDKAVPFLEKCRGLGRTPQEAQLIDVKLKSIAAMQKAPVAPTEPPKPVAKPKAAESEGSAVIDKVSDDAARQEGPVPNEGSATGGSGQPNGDASSTQGAQPGSSETPATAPGTAPATAPAAPTDNAAAPDDGKAAGGPVAPTTATGGTAADDKATGGAGGPAAPASPGDAAAPAPTQGSAAPTGEAAPANGAQPAQAPETRPGT